MDDLDPLEAYAPIVFWCGVAWWTLDTLLDAYGQTAFSEGKPLKALKLKPDSTQKVMKVILLAMLLLASGQAFAAGLAVKASFVMAAEVNLSTNTPSVTITHFDGSTTNLGTGWTNALPVQDGDTWGLEYPAQCPTSDASPVALTGLYSLVDTTNGAPLISTLVWIRMPPYTKAVKYRFTFNKYADGVLSWTMITNYLCNP